MEEVFVALIVIGSMFGVVYLFFGTRHKERMALIEKGENADLFVSSRRKSSIPLYAVLLINLGILGVGIGVGILMGQFFYAMGMDEDVSFPSSIFISVGLSLILGFLITRNIDRKYRDDE